MMRQMIILKDMIEFPMNYDIQKDKNVLKIWCIQHKALDANEPGKQENSLS